MNRKIKISGGDKNKLPSKVQTRQPTQGIKPKASGRKR